MRDGQLHLARTTGPLRVAWSFEKVNLAGLDPSMVVVAQEPDQRWYVTFTVKIADPQPLPAVEHSVGVDLGVHDFAVTSDSRRIPNPGSWNAKVVAWPGTSGVLLARSATRATARR